MGIFSEASEQEGDRQYLVSPAITSFFVLNFGYGPIEIEKLDGITLPVEDKNPEFKILLNEIPRAGSLLSLEYDGEKYDQAIPGHLLNYLFYLIKKEEGPDKIKFDTIETVVEEIKRKYEEEKGIDMEKIFNEAFGDY